MADGFALKGYVKLDRHQSAVIDALDLADYGLLVKLVRHVDSRERRYRCTQAELGEWVGLDRKNLRKRLLRLEELGLVKVDFPRGHKGTVHVLCYDDVVVPDSQGATRPLRETPGRKGRGHPKPTGADTDSTRGDSPPHKGQVAPCDQGPLSTLSDPFGDPANPPADGDTAPPADLSHSSIALAARDALAAGRAQAAQDERRRRPARRAGTPPRSSIGAASQRDHLRGAEPPPGPRALGANRTQRGAPIPSERSRAAGAETEATADVGRRAVREAAEVDDLEGPHHVERPALDTGSRAVAEVAAANERSSLGLRGRDPRATAPDANEWPATGTEGR